MWAIHSWCGLYAGVVIAVLSITGVAALFKVELDYALNPSLFYVEPQAQQAEVTPIIDSVAAHYPAGSLYAVNVPKEKNESWYTNFFFKNEGPGAKQIQVFIDPYTGAILGTRDYYYSFAFFLRHTHVRLYEPFVGRQIVGLAGIALLISTITGFWIYGGFMKKQFFAVIRKKNLRIQMADFHKLIGVSTLFFNLMIAITGAWLGLQAYLEPAIVGDRPGEFIPKELPLSKEEDKNYKFDFEEVLAKTRASFPEFTPSFISPSYDGSRTVTVKGTVPRTAFERDRFRITFDKAGLEEIDRYDIRNAGFGDKVYMIQESMHFGDYGGIVLKVIYSFFGFTSGFLALTGFIVYLKRTEKKRLEKPKFIELRPLLLRWTYAILAGVVILAALQMNVGLVIPSLVVIVGAYATILFLLAKALVLYFRRLRLKKAIS